MLDRMLNGPIPGQSLTRTPGSAPWERPPQYVDPGDAMEYLFTQMTEPDTALRLAATMEAGATVSQVTHALLMSGFTEGKWSPDVSLLLIKPVATLLFRIAEIYDVPVKSGADSGAVRKEFIELARQEEELAMDEGTEAELAEIEMPEIPSGGLMSPKRGNDELSD